MNNPLQLMSAAAAVSMFVALSSCSTKEEMTKPAAPPATAKPEAAAKAETAPA
jgi:hypothetical protein